MNYLRFFFFGLLIIWVCVSFLTLIVCHWGQTCCRLKLQVFSLDLRDLSGWLNLSVTSRWWSATRPRREELQWKWTPCCLPPLSLSLIGVRTKSLCRSPKLLFSQCGDTKSSDASTHVYSVNKSIFFSGPNLTKASDSHHMLMSESNVLTKREKYKVM